MTGPQADIPSDQGGESYLGAVTTEAHTLAESGVIAYGTQRIIRLDVFLEGGVHSTDLVAPDRRDRVLATTVKRIVEIGRGTQYAPTNRNLLLSGPEAIARVTYFLSMIEDPYTRLAAARTAHSMLESRTTDPMWHPNSSDLEPGETPDDLLNKYTRDFFEFRRLWLHMDPSTTEDTRRRENLLLALASYSREETYIHAYFRLLRKAKSPGARVHSIPN